MNVRQNVLVTGAASGIGLAIARQFLVSGARVHICDVNSAAVDDAVRSNPNMTGTPADVGVPEQVERVVAEALERFDGSLSVLVNNVGIGGPHKNVDALSYREWDDAMRINVGAMFYCIKQVVPVMRAKGGGAIVNISTASVKTKPSRRVDYLVSKAAVEALSESLAKELGPVGIRCNTVRPGVMDNPRMRGICEKYAREQGRSVDDVEQDYLKYVSMRSKIEEQEIGHACVFLASSRARHITGQTLSVCGNLEWEG